MKKRKSILKIISCVLALLPYYTPRIDQPVDEHINQGYVNQLRSEWLEEGYIDAP